MPVEVNTTTSVSVPTAAEYADLLARVAALEAAQGGGTSASEIVGPPVSCRMSWGWLAGVQPTYFLADSRDRRADNYYTGHWLHVAGHAPRKIMSFGNNRWGTVDPPWDPMPAIGTYYEIFADQPDRWGRRWRFVVNERQVPIGNGGGGALCIEYDRSAASDWSDPVRMVTIGPRGTPGQNGDDGEFIVHAQGFKVQSGNTLRGHPRWQDGNLLVPPDAHTGTDATPLDLGPEITEFRDGDIAPNGSILGSRTSAALNSNGVVALFGQTYWRVASNAAGAETGEFVVCPAGPGNPYRWVHAHDGLYREDHTGSRTRIL